jgi:hypothetical protein
MFAWLALEIFVNKVFKDYEKDYIENIIGSEQQKSLKPFVDRVQEVMRSKYRLVDKFSLIIAYLSEDPAKDIDTFKEMKRIRDSIFHGEAIEDESLPVENAQKLLSFLLLEHLRESI